VLRHKHRERDARGRLIATHDDYKTVFKEAASRQSRDRDVRSMMPMLGDEPLRFMT
jgi:hypothetical protein